MYITALGHMSHSENYLQLGCTDMHHRDMDHTLLGLFYKHNCDHDYFVLRSALIGVYRIGLTNELRMLFTQKNTRFAATLTVFFLTSFFFLFKCLGASLLCPFRWGLAFTRHFCGNKLWKYYAISNKFSKCITFKTKSTHIKIFI